MTEIRRDRGGRRGTNHMPRYLTDRPEVGSLAHETMGMVDVQYGRSFEHLEAFARGADDPHLAARRNDWRRVGEDDRAGIWHERSLVRVGASEATSGKTPPHGLGGAGRLVPVAESWQARTRSRSSRRPVGSVDLGR